MSIYDKSIKNVADAAYKIMTEKLHPNQQKLDVHEPEKDKLTADDFKKLRAGKKPDMKKEDVGLDEGRVGQVSADLTDLSHAEFQKEYGKPKSHFDPTNFKKPVQPGKEMDRAKALAQRGMASVKKEETEQGVAEGSDDELNARPGMWRGDAKRMTAKGKPTKDELGMQDNLKNRIKASNKKGGLTGPKGVLPEQLQEYQAKDGVYQHKGTYGRAKDMEAGETNWDKEDKLAKDFVKPEVKKRTYGAHQKRRTNTKLYKEMLESLQSGGIKSLFRTIEEGKIYEEASEEEFNSELADQKAKFDGKKKGANVAAPATQGVKNVKEAVHTELQIIDMTDGLQRPQVTIVDLEEKKLTAAETAKKEEIVKSMKKGLSSFKDRYGDRAKEVMYATATKTAKEKA